MSVKIKGLETLKQKLEPELHKKVFVATANELISNSVRKTGTQIKKKWNINIKKGGRDVWKFAHKGTGKTNKRGGQFRIRRAKVTDKYIEVTVTGDPIPLSLFSYSIVQEVGSKRTANSKERALKKYSKLSSSSRKKVRVKVLKSKTTTLDKAFWATMKSGHTGIYERATNKRKPIFEKSVITPKSMFEQVDFKRIQREEFAKNGLKRYQHNLKRMSKGAWK